MNYQEYTIALQDKCDEVYEIAGQARKKGFDPKNYVEIPQAHDLADRTQKLLDFLHLLLLNQIHYLTFYFHLYIYDV